MLYHIRVDLAELNSCVLIGPSLPDVLEIRASVQNIRLNLVYRECLPIVVHMHHQDFLRDQFISRIDGRYSASVSFSVRGLTSLI
jgi:hypothetical protein